MKKVIRLTESDLVRIVKRVINENKRFGSFDDEEWYDDTDRLTSKDDFDFDYDVEEFPDFDSYHNKYPLDSEDSPSWFKSNNKDYSKNMFDLYKNKHNKPFKVRTRRGMDEQNIGGTKLASNIKSQNDDRELLKKACEVYKGISSPEAKQKILNWTKKYTGTQYPYKMTEACSNQSYISVTSENDRKILKGIINYDWM